MMHEIFRFTLEDYRIFIFIFIIPILQKKLLNEWNAENVSPISLYSVHGKHTNEIKSSKLQNNDLLHSCNLLWNYSMNFRCIFYFYSVDSPIIFCDPLFCKDLCISRIRFDGITLHDFLVS